MNKKSQANVFSIKLDSFYVLTKGTNGVHAKYWHFLTPLLKIELLLLIAMAPEIIW
jgi:hypothetical protein